MPYPCVFLENLYNFQSNNWWLTTQLVISIILLHNIRFSVSFTSLMSKGFVSLDSSDSITYSLFIYFSLYFPHSFHLHSCKFYRAKAVAFFFSSPQSNHCLAFRSAALLWLCRILSLIAYSHGTAFLSFLPSFFPLFCAHIGNVWLVRCTCVSLLRLDDAGNEPTRTAILLPEQLLIRPFTRYFFLFLDPGRLK